MTNPTTVTLAKPLTFGETEISEIVLRRPSAGDLRGIKLQDVIDMDVNTILTLTQRLSITALAPNTLYDMDSADLSGLTSALADFFNPAARSPTTP